ncbi:MAG TPA: SRPBCC family protein [Solirubrobacterales bacterium]
MTTESQSPTVVGTETTVAVPRERAFEFFTAQIEAWWNPDHHLIDAKLERMVFEPRVGGHIYDVGVDGSECRWARVVVYDPPARIVFTWDISPSWQLETDPDKTSEVEVRFVEEEPGRTRVELEHRNLDRHGEGWERVRGGVGSPGGWPAGLEGFARALG